jgi:SPP1 family predicted phage head-tail adaptor
MRNGARRSYLEIQRLDDTGRKDKLKQPIKDWAKAFECYAEVDSKGGREIYDNKTQQRYFTTTFVFTCPFNDVDGVDEGMRIVFEGANYDIRSVAPDFARKETCVIIATLQNKAFGASADHSRADNSGQL